MALAGVACAAVLLTSGTAVASEEPSTPPVDTSVVDTGTAPADTTFGYIDETSPDGDAAPTAAAATCTLSLGKPWKENISSTGRSDHSRATYKTVNNCAGFALSATLQYHRWHGWSGLASADWAGNRSSRILQWKCQGQGTFTYRMAGVVRGGSNPGGDPHVGRGNGPERRFGC